MRLYTVGHSTRAIEALIELLQAHGVRELVDVRSVPHSRRHPQFNREAMPAPLAAADIAYTHLPGLGGLRPSYVDYMKTPAFATALAVLIERAAGAPTAIMCAEADPSHCHRSLISDALVAAGVDVRHILTVERAEAHVARQHNLPLPGLGG